MFRTWLFLIVGSTQFFCPECDGVRILFSSEVQHALKTTGQSKQKTRATTLTENHQQTQQQKFNKTSLPPLPVIEEIPQLDPQEQPLEVEVGNIYEAQDENDRWRAILVTDIIEPGVKYAAIVSEKNAAELGADAMKYQIGFFKEMQDWRKKAEEARKLKQQQAKQHLLSADAEKELQKQLAEEEEKEKAAAQKQDNPVFPHKWDMIYHRYMRRVPLLDEPPKGFR